MSKELIGLHAYLVSLEICAAWNELCPPGTPVTMTNDVGGKIDTKTRSVAWVLGGDPVVMVEGIAGGYLLSRMVPR